MIDPDQEIWCERCNEREATESLGDALYCRSCTQDVQRELDREGDLIYNESDDWPIERNFYDD